MTSARRCRKRKFQSGSVTTLRPLRNPAKTVYVGIDPGKAGALAMIYPDGQVDSWLTPTRKRSFGGELSNMYSVREMHRFVKLAAHWRDKEKHQVHVVIERQAGRPVTSKKNVFASGMGMGIWFALLDLYGFSDFHWVSPNSWKKAFGLDNDKRKSLALCAYLYPKHPLPRMKDEARAEAILLAEFYKRRQVSING